jgi:hypothetical protein
VIGGSAIAIGAPLGAVDPTGAPPADPEQALALIAAASSAARRQV